MCVCVCTTTLARGRVRKERIAKARKRGEGFSRKNRRPDRFPRLDSLDEFVQSAAANAAAVYGLPLGLSLSLINVASHIHTQTCPTGYPPSRFSIHIDVSLHVYETRRALAPVIKVFIIFFGLVLVSSCFTRGLFFFSHRSRPYP